MSALSMTGILLDRGSLGRDRAGVAWLQDPKPPSQCSWGHALRHVLALTLPLAGRIAGFGAKRCGLPREPGKGSLPRRRALWHETMRTGAFQLLCLVGRGMSAGEMGGAQALIPSLAVRRGSTALWLAGHGRLGWGLGCRRASTHGTGHSAGASSLSNNCCCVPCRILSGDDVFLQYLSTVEDNLVSRNVDSAARAYVADLLVQVGVILGRWVGGWDRSWHPAPALV